MKHVIRLVKVSALSLFAWEDHAWSIYFLRNCTSQINEIHFNYILYRFYKKLILYITYSAFFICCQLFCCFWIQTSICSVRTTFVKVCLYLLQLYCILLVSAVWFCSGQNSSRLSMQPCLSSESTPRGTELIQYIGPNTGNTSCK